MENLVDERDQLLVESSKRFEKLKDDFEYNLALIQARDVEIERLEHDLRICNRNLEESKSERKNLSMQLEAMQMRETELVKKWEQEKLSNKVL